MVVRAAKSLTEGSTESSMMNSEMCGGTGSGYELVEITVHGEDTDDSRTASLHHHMPGGAHPAFYQL